MNWIKALTCWWNKQHIFINYYDREGRRKIICVRCGTIRD